MAPSASDAKARLAATYDRLFVDQDGSRADADRSRMWLHAGYRDVGGEPSRRPWGRLHADHARMLDLLIGETSLDGAVVLEVGAGRGGNLYAVQQWFAPRSLIAVDLSSECCSATAALLCDSVQVVRGDAELLPIQSASIDVVLSVESAGHYPDRLAFLAEAARVLRPGGHFLCADSMFAEQEAVLQAACTQLGMPIHHRGDISAGVAAHWARLSRSSIAADVAANMSADELELSGPGVDSALGAFLDGSTAPYLQFRATRTSAPAVARAQLEIEEAISTAPDLGEGVISAFAEWGKQSRQR